MNSKSSPNSQMNRRNFLTMGLTGLSLFTAGCVFKKQLFTEAAFNSLSSIGELLPADENGIMLPAGFKSRIVARSGEAPTTSSSYIWHGSPDGGAIFDTDDGGWIYVSNSEITKPKGGAGALRFNSNAEIIDAYPILTNTDNNCAGGPTPWGTWLSCEEVQKGQVYECDPFGIKPAVVRPALGTFMHEAVAVDTVNQCLYLTEDVPDGGLYRFRPTNGLPDLTEGKLEIASVVNKNGESDKDGIKIIKWLTVPDPLAQKVATRKQVKGYTSFRGGEGIVIHKDNVYFTTKHDNRVWQFNHHTQELDIIYDIASSYNPILKGVDNLVITPTGDVLVAEDQGDMQLVALTPDQQVIPFLQIIGHKRSEITGPAFDPTYQRMYFSSQRGLVGKGTGGITFEISRIGDNNDKNR
ncbi:MAG: secreted PhoX family phosphatase [Enterobacterales bacterium]|jgi:secreted PhoX family phosphatase